jgi:acyl dehydratase
MEVFRTAESLEAALGREIGPTEWMNIEQTRVNQFADVTEDRQWIHVDQKRAASGPYGGTVAHGFLTVALIPYLLRSLLNIESTRGINYGLNKVRSLHPSLSKAGSELARRSANLKSWTGALCKL